MRFSRTLPNVAQKANRARYDESYVVEIVSKTEVHPTLRPLSKPTAVSPKYVYLKMGFAWRVLQHWQKAWPQIPNSSCWISKTIPPPNWDASAGPTPRAMPELRSLNLSDCLVGRAGGVALATSLSLGTNAKLEELRLQYGEVDRRTVELLSEGVAQFMGALRVVE